MCLSNKCSKASFLLDTSFWNAYQFSKFMYSLLFVSVIFFVFAYKYRRNILALILFVFYGIGVLSGHILTTLPLYVRSGNSGYQDISWSASLYLLFSFIILFYPIYNIKEFKFSIVDNININHFVSISIILISFSVIFSICVIPYMSMALNTLDFVGYKDDVMSNGGLDLSYGNSILEKITKFQIIFRPYITFMFYFSLARIKNHRNLKILLGMASIFPPVLHTLGAAHRNILVFSLVDSIVCFLLFYKEYSKKIQRIFVIIFAIIGAFVGLIVVVFAILRFSDNGSDFVEYSLYRYLGEPFVDFNTMIWGTDYLLYGNKSFPFVRDFLGLPYIDPLDIRTELSNTPYIIYYFYSIVGNFYMDFGPYITLCLIILIAFFFNYLIKKVYNRNTMSRMLLLFLFVTYTIRNYFYFEFMGGNNMLFIWVCFFFLFFTKYITYGNK